MKKMYFIGLSILALASCSPTNDDLQNFESPNLSAAKDASLQSRFGFIGSQPSIVWVKGTIPPKPIYGFYSSHMNKHLYSPFSMANMLPRTQPGQYYYFLDRFLGSAKGEGQEITGWFNEITEDYVITTNPSEFNGQNGWRKNDNFGSSYTGTEEGSYPIYRYFRNSTKSHFYTKDFNELGNGKEGFVYEGISFYLKECEPENIRIRDGQFYQDNNTKAYYIVFEGKVRHIESIETIRRVFDFKGDPRGNGQPKEYLISKVNIDDIKGERGLPIIPTALIYQDVDTGIMYFSDPQSNGRGGSNLKKIPNTTVFNRYRFNTDHIVKTRGINNPRINDIEITY
ncbi:hypothetical protein [Elizabethkingia ursingii]|nr:hypothetical protein [Elizabethkingia ursingii]